MPDIASQWPPGTDERIETPGALMSGFSRSESGVGPAELKSARVAARLPSGLVTAATVIACVGRAGRDQRAAAELVEVVPGRDDRDDAGRGGGVERERDEVARRLDLGLADREVDHVHAVGDRGLDRGDDLGRVAVEADVRVGRDAERLVVADVGARSDARDLDAAGCGGAGVAGGDAGDVGRVPGLDRVERLARVLPRRPAGANARATITLAVVYAAWPFGKPAGIV